MRGDLSAGWVKCAGVGEMYSFDERERELYFEGERLDRRWTGEELAGFCSGCGGELSSLGCYSTPGGWLVASRCRGCGSIVLAEYDSRWAWKGDREVAAAPPTPGPRKMPRISEIPREELEAVFTPAELRDMERCERGEPYLRQNLYRARAKYEKFERLFGVRIDI